MTHGPKHAAVAILVALTTLSPTAGVTVYASREQRDLEKGYGVTLKSLKTKEGRTYAYEHMDWEALLWPAWVVGPFAVIEITIKYKIVLYLISKGIS